MGSGQSVIDRPSGIDNPTREIRITPPKTAKSAFNRTVILIGLDNSGKTTLMEQLRRDPTEVGGVGDTQSTLVMDYAYLTHYNVQMFDMAGSQNNRSTWESMLNKKDAVIFCIDTTETDPSRIAIILDWLRIVREYVNAHENTVLAILGTKADIKKKDRFNWSDKGVEFEEINCLNCSLCHKFMRNLVMDINSKARDYERPVPQATVIRPVSDSKEISESPRAFCKWWPW